MKTYFNNWKAIAEIKIKNTNLKGKSAQTKCLDFLKKTILNKLIELSINVL